MKLAAVKYQKKSTRSISDALDRHAAVTPVVRQESGPGSMLEDSRPYRDSFEASLLRLQTKGHDSQQADRFELEADHVADRIVDGPIRSRRIADPSVPQSFPTLQALAHKMTHWSGTPLDAATRSFMEPHFGFDFGHVRVHTDGRAAVAADILTARAFTIGRNIVFGKGQYTPENHSGKRLLAHELTHTIQQQAGVAEPAIQCDVIGDVRDKLSYGILDWAITDSEAMEALALLGTIPQANLANELKRLGSKYVTRLLDNLPDAAKSGDTYKRVIEALGPGGVVSFAKEQLSYGLFDWAITDAEVTRVFNTFVNLPAGKREQFLVDLQKAGRLGRLISNANTGHWALYIRPWIATLKRGALTQQQKSILRTIVANSSNSALDTLKLATEIRFDVTVGPSTITGEKPAKWDASQLRKTYLALDRLPEAHVAKNKQLLRFGQFSEDAAGSEITEGIYQGSKKELAINIKASGDINEPILHETGHAVDKEMGWSKGPEPAKPKRGGWKTYGANYNKCADEMVSDSGGAIKTSLKAPQRKDVVKEMAGAMGNRSATGLKGDIRKLPWFAGLTAPIKRQVLADNALKALRIGLHHPWFNASKGGEHLADHVYQESYPNTWVRYRFEARTRKVSKYQFRDPSEWFAEAYAYYYLPDPRGKGAKLADKDPDTKKYFDTHVDTLAASR